MEEIRDRVGLIGEKALVSFSPSLYLVLVVGHLAVWLCLGTLWPFVCFVQMCSNVFARSLTNHSHSAPFRCCVCFPAPQPSPQRSCSSDAGHPQASDRARLPPAGSAASPAGRLDQGRWRATAVADEAACCRPGGGCSQSRFYHRRHLSLTHDVCRANWGDDYGECCIYINKSAIIVSLNWRGTEKVISQY